MSRFEDTLQRDLTVIADRATPSPDAWAQIQSRIADQEPLQETEIIMLTDNTHRPRRWPVLAAAAAVAALVVGGIALVNRGDGDTNPADEPTPQTTVLPTPDDAAVVPDADSGADTDDTPAAATELRTVTLAGVSERTLEPVGPNPPPEGTWEGSSSMSAEGLRFDNTMTGTYQALADDVLDGTFVEVLIGTVDGIGTGSITVEGEFSQRGNESRSAGVITDASGAFDGAVGTIESIVDVNADRGTWTMELTLPGDRFAADFVEPAAVAGRTTGPASEPADLVSGSPATAGSYTTDALGTAITFEITQASEGTWQTEVSPGTVWLYTGVGDEFVQMTRIGGWYDAAEAVDPNIIGFGSIGASDIDRLIAERDDLEITDGGNVTVGDRPARLIEFGLDPTSPAGAGICDPGQRPCTWFVSRSEDAPGPDGGRGNALLGDRLVRAWVVDMDGYEPILIEGSTSLADKDAWLDDVLQPIVDSITIGAPTYAVPGGTASLTTEVVATGTWTDAGYAETANDDGSFTVTYVTTMEGDMRGESTPIQAFRIPDESGGSIGGALQEFTGEIDGLGTGTLISREEYVSLPVFVSVMVIVDGTGDFEGATGWALINPDSVAGTYEFHVSVPVVAPPAVDTESYRLTATFTDAGSEQVEIGPDTRSFTGSLTYTGDLEGAATYRGVNSTEGSGTLRGFDESVVFTGTIADIGTGSLVTAGPYRQDQNGQYVALELITGGTGDFAGASGTVLSRSSNSAITGTATFDLELPAG